MPKTKTRPVNWTGKPNREAVQAGLEYMEELRRYWATDEDHYYVPVAVDEETKGEP